VDCSAVARHQMHQRVEAIIDFSKRTKRKSFDGAERRESLRDRPRGWGVVGPCKKLLVKLARFKAVLRRNP